MRVGGFGRRRELEFSLSDGDLRLLRGVERVNHIKVMCPVTGSIPLWKSELKDEWRDLNVWRFEVVSRVIFVGVRIFWHCFS